jgi:hypothetical protein
LNSPYSNIVGRYNINLGTSSAYSNANQN